MSWMTATATVMAVAAMEVKRFVMGSPCVVTLCLYILQVTCQLWRFGKFFWFLNDYRVLATLVTSPTWSNQAQVRTFLHTLGTFLRTFGSHLCSSGLPGLTGAALAGGEDRSPVAHRRLCPMDVQLPTLARGHAEVIGVTDANLDSLRGVDGGLVRHVVVSVSLGHL